MEKLSLEKCRKHLGPDCKLSDGEVTNLRDCCYELADIIFTAYHKSRRNSSPSRKQKTAFENTLDHLPELGRDETIERAAIMEFDGGLPKEQAENLALSKYFDANCRRN